MTIWSRFMENLKSLGFFFIPKSHEPTVLNLDSWKFQNSLPCVKTLETCKITLLGQYALQFDLTALIPMV